MFLFFSLFFFFFFSLLSASTIPFTHYTHTYTYMYTHASNNTLFTTPIAGAGPMERPHQKDEGLSEDAPQGSQWRDRYECRHGAAVQRSLRRTVAGNVEKAHAGDSENARLLDNVVPKTLQPIQVLGGKWRTQGHVALRTSHSRNLFGRTCSGSLQVTRLAP